MNELSYALIVTTLSHDSRQAIGPDTVQLTPIQTKQKADRSHSLFEKSILAGCRCYLPAKNVAWPLRLIPGFVLLGSDAPGGPPKGPLERKEAKVMSTKRLSSAAALLGAAVGAFLPFSSVPARPGHEPTPLTSVLDRPDAERSRAGHTASAPSITNSDAALLELPSEPASP